MDNESKRIIKQSIISMIPIIGAAKTPFVGEILTRAPIIGVWTLMVIRLLNKYNVSFNKDVITEIIISIATGVIQIQILRYTLMIIGIPVFLPLFLMSFGVDTYFFCLITYKLGIFCDKEFSKPGFTKNTLEHFADLFIEFLKASLPNLVQDTRDMVVLLAEDTSE